MSRYRMKARIAMNLIIIIIKGNIFKNDKLKKKKKQ
jgi:hypothetical protein